MPAPFVPNPLPLQGIDWQKHITALGRANRAIAGYDSALYSIKNPDILLAPLTTQEAVLSSRIEGTQASLGDVFKSEAGEVLAEGKREDVQEILNYRQALTFAQGALTEKPFHLNLLLQLHEILLDSVRGRDKARGKFRTAQNWIGPEGCTMGEARFIPPDPLLLPDYLSAWEKYYHTDAEDPLVQLAIVHAQFEILHPFLDGNGRLGRMIVPLFLYEKKVLRQPTFYLSEYLEAHREEYISRLRALGPAEAWNEWIAFFLRALTGQAIANQQRTKAILDLYEQMKNRVRDVTHSQFSVTLLDALFARPFFKVSDLARLPAMPSGQMISLLVRLLAHHGVIQVIRPGKGRAPTIYRFTELLTLCDQRAEF